MMCLDDAELLFLIMLFLFVSYRSADPQGPFYFSVYLFLVG